MRNKFKLAKFMAMTTVVLLFSIEFTGIAVASDVAAKADTKRACLSRTADDPNYMVAVELVTSLPFVKDWSASLGKKSRMALGFDDKTEFIKGNCYWSISFYKSNSEQMQLWKIFRVNVDLKEIYVMDHLGKYQLIFPAQ